MELCTPLLRYIYNYIIVLMLIQNELAWVCTMAFLDSDFPFLHDYVCCTFEKLQGICATNPRVHPSKSYSSILVEKEDERY